LASATAGAHGQPATEVRIPYVQFRNAPNRPAIAFEQGRPEEGGRSAETGELRAKLWLLPGRTPMVVLLHGCAGMHNAPTEAWIRYWGSFFRQQGYSVMAIDSFTSRGVSETCGPPDAHWSYRRRDDAYSALNWLAALGRTDMDNVVVMGRSNGGRTVLRIIEAKMQAIRPFRFSRGIAMYPNCRNDQNTRFYAPLHVFIGAQDDANPAAFCEAMGRSGDSHVRVTIFPDTLHGFDDGSATRIDHGWRMGGNPRATEEVRRQIEVELRSG
jgi:dienelactone hydrolase